jgi:eukaryotic-like serine/threonine-protein kinase
MQAAEGMAVAHANGVYHRSLSPSSVLIRPESRRAQVTDLGLSMHGMTHARPSGDALRKGAAAASAVRYRAPEESRADAVDRDAWPPTDHDGQVRIDIYRLGAMLYELLAGEPPPLARGGASHASAGVGHRTGITSARPFGRWPRRAPGFRVPARLDRIVRKAMAYAPSDRYRSCSALADDLALFLRREPASGDASHYLLRTYLWTRRHWRYVSAAASLAASAAAVGSYLWAKHEADQVHARVVMSAQELRGAQAELQRVKDALRVAELRRDPISSGASGE